VVFVATRALQAFSEALKMPPVLAAGDLTWGGIAVCDWALPWIDGFELKENDDFIVAYHSAGSRQVRAACNGPWSDSTSIPGMVSVIPPGRRVEYRIEGNVSFCTIHIPRTLLKGLSTSAFVETPNFRFAFEDVFASSCIEILLRQARRDGYCDFPYVYSVTRALILHLMAGFRSDGPPNTRGNAPQDHRDAQIDSLLDYIDSSLGEPLTLDGLAERAAVSRAHFVRRFRAATGVSPHRYLVLRRIEKAKLLLRGSSLPLADIALSVGFSSQSHFTQVFHLATGQTPSQFRNT
jgi:AraC family transcriptional regulator